LRVIYLFIYIFILFYLLYYLFFAEYELHETLTGMRFEVAKLNANNIRK